MKGCRFRVKTPLLSSTLHAVRRFARTLRDNAKIAGSCFELRKFRNWRPATIGLDAANPTSPAAASGVSLPIGRADRGRHAMWQLNKRSNQGRRLFIGEIAHCVGALHRSQGKKARGVFLISKTELKATSYDPSALTYSNSGIPKKSATTPVAR